MKKIIIITLMAAGMLVGTLSAVSAETIRDCVIAKGETQLSEGQMAFLTAHGDGEINVLSTANDNNLTLVDGAKVHAHMWGAGISCVFGG